MSTVVPHLSVRDGFAAMEFYKKAFGAVEQFRLAAPDGKRLLHGCVQIGDSFVYLADEFPEYGGNCKAPPSLGGTSVTIHLNSPDADAAFARAIAAGAKVAMPLADMFWGSRYGIVVDPFGHSWSISTPIREVTPEQMKAGAEAAFSKRGMQQQQQQQQ